MEGIRKEYLVCQKWYIKGKGSELGAEPPRIKFRLVPLPPRKPGHYATLTVCGISSLRWENNWCDCRRSCSCCHYTCGNWFSQEENTKEKTERPACKTVWQYISFFSAFDLTLWRTGKGFSWLNKNFFKKTAFCSIARGFEYQKRTEPFIVNFLC